MKPFLLSALSAVFLCTILFYFTIGSAQNAAAPSAATDKSASQLGSQQFGSQASIFGFNDSATQLKWERLFLASKHTLEHWVSRLQAEARNGFPEKVTAFRKGMAVHGRYGEPCPRCGEKVLRIRYADNEANYCATCQTGGRVLADRSLSRLLKADWPRSLEEWEAKLGR